MAENNEEAPVPAETGTPEGRAQARLVALAPFEDQRDSTVAITHTAETCPGRPCSSECDHVEFAHGGSDQRISTSDYVVEVRLTVNDNVAQGDEQELFEQHVHEAMKTFGLAGCRVRTTPVERRSTVIGSAQ